MPKVTFEFDLNEDKEELKMFQNVDKMYFALDEIFGMVRNELKHGDEELSEHIEHLLERIKDESWFIHEL